MATATGKQSKKSLIILHWVIGTNGMSPHDAAEMLASVRITCDDLKHPDHTIRNIVTTNSESVGLDIKCVYPIFVSSSELLNQIPTPELLAQLIKEVGE